MFSESLPVNKSSNLIEYFKWFFTNNNVNFNYIKKKKSSLKKVCTAAIELCHSNNNYYLVLIYFKRIYTYGYSLE